MKKRVEMIFLCWFGLFLARQFPPSWTSRIASASPMRCTIRKRMKPSPQKRPAPTATPVNPVHREAPPRHRLRRRRSRPRSPWGIESSCLRRKSFSTRTGVALKCDPEGKKIMLDRATCTNLPSFFVKVSNCCSFCSVVVFSNFKLISICTRMTFSNNFPILILIFTRVFWSGQFVFLPQSCQCAFTLHFCLKQTIIHGGMSSPLSVWDFSNQSINQSIIHCGMSSPLSVWDFSNQSINRGLCYCPKLDTFARRQVLSEVQTGTSQCIFIQVAVQWWQTRTFPRTNVKIWKFFLVYNGRKIT